MIKNDDELNSKKGKKIETNKNIGEKNGNTWVRFFLNKYKMIIIAKEI